jgi:xanthine dehydrogenase accessory factor
MLDIYQELVNVVASGKRAVLATVISSRGSAPQNAGAKMLIKEDGTLVGTVGGGASELLMQEKATEVMNSGAPQILHLDLSGTGKDAVMICGGEMDIFLEPILPRETVYLFGAGHVSRSTASMAKALGFRVVIIDPRPSYNNEDRFPDADLLVVEDFDKSFSKLDVDRDSYIIIATTGHVLDEQCLECAIRTKAKYIGMLGSKKKVKEIKERLQQKGVSREQLDGVHAPVGLAIGAETPEEIAVSILAEVIKVRRALTT